MDSESIKSALSEKNSTLRVQDIKNAQQYLLTKGYELLSIIGVGGFGVILKAHCIKTNSTVAIKVIFVEQPRQIELCFSEAKMMVYLKSDYVVKLLEQLYDQDFQLFFIITPLYTKGDLQKYMKANKQIPQYQIIEIFIGILKGIRDINSQKIIHGDLKPQNIVMDEQEKPLLIDFGLSRKLSSNQSKISIAGKSIHYAPQEQMKGNLVLETDFYSAGVILFELCGFQISLNQALQMKQEIFPTIDGLPHQQLLEIAKSMMKIIPKSRANPSDVIEKLNQILNQRQRK